MTDYRPCGKPDKAENAGTDADRQDSLKDIIHNRSDAERIADRIKERPAGAERKNIMDSILNDKELLNVVGGTLDEIDPNLKMAKEAVFAAFRVAEGLRDRKENIEDLLRDTYQKLYGVGMDIPGAQRNLALAREATKIILWEGDKPKEIRHYIDLALDALAKIK